MRILSWNIAGIRAKLKKKYLNFLLDSNISVICFQETKGTEEEIEKCIHMDLKQKFPYRYYSSCSGTGAQRKGLNGVSIWSKYKPCKIIEPMDFGKDEGRTLGIDLGIFTIITVYTPNGQSYNSERFNFRVNEWDSNFRSWINQQTNKTIVCGDFNVAYTKNDLHHRWWGEDKLVGASIEERNNFKKLLDDGWKDTYKYIKEKDGRFFLKKKFTYWDQRIPIYKKYNIGWRIDYFLVNKEMEKYVKKNQILDKIEGSDHCPIKLNVNLKI